MAHKVGRTHVPTPSLSLSDENLAAIFNALPIGGGAIRKTLGNLANKDIIKKLLRMKELSFKRANVPAGSKAAREAIIEQRKLVEDIRKIQARDAKMKK